MPNLLNNPIEYLNGISAVRGDLLRKELQLFTWGDFLEHYPLRHQDKTSIDPIGSLQASKDYGQVAGTLISLEIMGERRGRRLVAQIRDQSGILELVWFQGIQWVQKSLQIGQTYLVFGRLSFFMGKPQIAHPEIERFQPSASGGKPFLEPIYPSTEKLKAKGLHGKMLGSFTREIFEKIHPDDLPENIPADLLEKFRLPTRYESVRSIHFPASEAHYRQALRRLKFEEFFYAQLGIQMIRMERLRFSKGLVFEQVGEHFHTFFEHHLPFPLTGAQKKVIREIRKDMGSGKQMNRLLQGDVGSGKTMVALLCMLVAIDNGFQSVLMAPTEILAQQHAQSLREYLTDMPIQVGLLTGSTAAKERKVLLKAVAEGEIQILVGTHAIIEDAVQFHNLGLAVVDEQHKFGVAQRARLWKKNQIPPHILVMTATPIPRTLAMTAYGDLDYSVIDELPPGRKPIQTLHKPESERPAVMGFIREQIAAGRQAYIIYPLIEESSKMDYENLQKGYEEVKAFFPEPRYWISMVHGRQDGAQKEANMQRFVSGDTQIMVSTTVIEVGVNVPNASVMVIESAEKFGLSQLHQLRGRVGRGAEQSYCILLSGPKLGQDARERLQTMVQTQDGFVIAEKDLQLRGPGDLQGTRQSGMLNFKLADLVQDKAILEAARLAVQDILLEDPDLTQSNHACIKLWLKEKSGKTGWSRIA